jgi:hypothetical protein
VPSQISNTTKWRAPGKVSPWGDSPNLLWPMIINLDFMDSEQSTGERKKEKARNGKKVNTKINKK